MKNKIIENEIEIEEKFAEIMYSTASFVPSNTMIKSKFNERQLSDEELRIARFKLQTGMEQFREIAHSFSSSFLHYFEEYECILDVYGNQFLYFYEDTSMLRIASDGYIIGSKPSERTKTLPLSEFIKYIKFEAAFPLYYNDFLYRLPLSAMIEFLKKNHIQFY